MLFGATVDAAMAPRVLPGPPVVAALGPALPALIDQLPIHVLEPLLRDLDPCIRFVAVVEVVHAHHPERRSQT
jgi:hypothetical protein